MKDPNRFYTYAYLREDRTPYYVGKGEGRRLYKKGKCEVKPPKDKSRVIFLKENLTEEECKKIKQIIIEFYNEEETYVLEKLMKTHLLVHLDINTKYPMKKKNGLEVPQRFVCTYIRKD